MTTRTHIEGLVAPGFEEMRAELVYRAIPRLTDRPDSHYDGAPDKRAA